MELELTRLAKVSGDSNKYQYITLFIGILIWATLNILNVSIPFLEIMPIVSYHDKDTGTYYEGVELTYAICENQKYVIDKHLSKPSWVYQHEIYCSRIKTGLIGGFLSLGLLIGGLLQVFLVDYIGRRSTMLMSALGYSLTIFLFNFTLENLYFVYILEMILGVWSCNCALSSLLYLQEITNSKKMPIFTGIINASYASGGILSSLLYKYSFDWQINFNISFGMGIIVSILITAILVESPKFYYINGKIIEFLDSYKKIAKYNNLTPAFEYWVASNFNKLERLFYYEEVVGNGLDMEKGGADRYSSGGNSKDEVSDLTLNVKSFTNNTYEIDSSENHDYNDLREKIYKIYGTQNLRLRCWLKF